MISRSEYGPRCPHCTRINPAATLKGEGPAMCMHCEQPFRFWIEELPFYCTDDKRPSRCDCGVCAGKVEPVDEIRPGEEPGE